MSAPPSSLDRPSWIRITCERFSFESWDTKDSSIAGHQTVDTATMMHRIEDHRRKVYQGLVPNLIWESIKDLQLIRLCQQASIEPLVDKSCPDVIYERSISACRHRLQTSEESIVARGEQSKRQNVIKLSGRSLLTRRAAIEWRLGILKCRPCSESQPHLAEHSNHSVL